MQINKEIVKADRNKSIVKIVASYTELVELAQALLNSMQTDRNKKNLFNDENLPLTIKPNVLKQVSVTNDNKIKIINTFE